MITTLVNVPDIGDFDAIPVIEILVTSGQSVVSEQSLVTLESDKATLDVPAPDAGVVGNITVSLGDLVSEGSLLMELQVTRSASPPSRSQNLTRIHDTTPEKLTTEHVLSRDEHSCQAKLPANSSEGSHTAIDSVAANNSSTIVSAGVVSTNKQTPATPSGTIQPGQPQRPHRYHATPAIRRLLAR